jgi:hypothetical protein
MDPAGALLLAIFGPKNGMMLRTAKRDGRLDHVFSPLHPYCLRLPK